MDSFKLITDIIETNRNGLVSENYNIYINPRIPQKHLEKASINLCKGVSLNSILCICSITIRANYKNGFVFTADGVYFKEMFEKIYYINYKDIDTVTIDRGKDLYNSKLLIKLNDGTLITYGDLSVNKRKFMWILSDIKRLINENKIVPDESRISGEYDASNLSKEQKNKCNAIIHTASASAGAVGTGLAQIPLSDNALIVPIQITMIISLGKVFDIRLTEGAAKGVLATVGSSFVGRGISQVLIGWIPGIGNAINSATAAGVTEATGWAAVKHFSSLSYKEKMKYAKQNQEAEKKGYERGKAEASEEINSIKSQLKEVCEKMNDYKQQHYFILAAISISIAAANIKGSITSEEYQYIKEIIGGATVNVWPETLTNQVNELFINKPSFNEAIIFVRKVNYKYWEIFEEIIIELFKIDNSNMDLKKAFKSAWDDEMKRGNSV